MNDKSENLTKRMTQSLGRRVALKKLGVGLAGMALAFVALISTSASSKADYHPQVNIAPIHANAGITAVLTSTSDPAVSIAIATGVVQTSLLGTCVGYHPR
jgi:hypothetical protein